MKSVFRNSVFNLIGQLTPLAAALVAMPVTERAYGMERFSLLALVWTLLGYFSFLDLGFGRSTTKFLAEAISRNDRASQPAIVWISLTTNAAVGILCAGILFLCLPYLTHRLFTIPPVLLDETATLCRLLTLSIPAITVSSGLRGALEASERFAIVNAIKSPSNSLLFLIPILGVVFSWPLVSSVILIVLSRFLTAATYLFFVRRQIPTLFSSFLFRRGHFFTLLRFGGWVSIINVLSPLITYVERFIILSLLPVAWFAYYSVPSEMISRMVFIPASLSLTLFPKFSAQGFRSPAETLERLIGKPTKFLLFILTPVTLGCIIFSREILTLWMNAQFAEYGGPVLTILAFAVFFNALAQIPFAALQGLGHPDRTAAVIIVESILYVGLSWAGVSAFGIVGAACVKWITLGAECAVLFALTLHALGFRGRNLFSGAFRSSVYVSISVLVFGVAVFLLSRSSLIHIGMFTMLLVTYALYVWKRCIPDDEKTELLGLWRSFGRPAPSSEEITLPNA
jgi:O-antigen/teichoic acid export membrane protein